MGEGISKGVKDSGRSMTLMRQRVKEQLSDNPKPMDVEMKVCSFAPR